MSFDGETETPKVLTVRRPCLLPSGGGVCGGGCAPSQKIFSIFELKKASFGAFWVLFLQLNWTETGFVYKMREILTMRWVSGRWSPKCGSLPRDAGDLVGLHRRYFCFVFVIYLQ